MPKVVFKFKNKASLDEAMGYALPRMMGGSKSNTINESHLVIEGHEDNIEQFRSLMNEFKESKRLNALTAKVIGTLSSTIAEGKNRTIRLMNGDLIRLSPNDAKTLVAIHDQLSEENQAALRMMVIETRKSHEAAIQFCLDKSKETE